MKDFKKVLADYKSWSEEQSWINEVTKEVVNIQLPPKSNEIALLEEKFGKLPDSYLSVLESFGLSSYRYMIYWTRMLSPKEIIEYYEHVQNEMDFHDEPREIILEEDQIDFSKHIPVMAGTGQDGCWALLNIENGSVLYWDTDQPAYGGDVYDNLEAFILDSIESAKNDEPIRLT